MRPKLRADARNHRVMPDAFASMAALLRDPEVAAWLVAEDFSAVASDEIEANGCVNYET